MASPPKAKADCHYCARPISDDHFIRVGSYTFHKNHFLCYECEKLLHGKKFHHRDGKFYCSQDYHSKFTVECAGCQKKILKGRMIKSDALKGCYHPQCFVCAKCNEVFDQGKYFPYKGLPYCQDHILEIRGDRCVVCKEPVPDPEKRRVKDTVFHARCLTCTFCHTELGGKERLFQKDGKYYCRNDYLSFFGKRCTACGKHITQKCVSVNDETYHPTCLRCSVCDDQMKSYMCLRGNLRCKTHAKDPIEEVKCTVCNELIKKWDKGDVMMAVGHKTHAQCFKCHKCEKPLAKKTAKLMDEKYLSCSACLMKPKKKPLFAGAAPRASLPYQAPTLTKTVSDTELPSAVNTAADPTLPPVANVRERAHSRRTQSNVLDQEMLVDNKITPKPKARPTPGRTATTLKPVVEKPKHHSSKSWAGPASQHIDWVKGSLIGAGSFGKVFMGMNKKTGELIAVKQVTFNEKEDDMMKSIEMEINLMRSLDHPNIVQFLDCQRAGKKLNILMEYVPGSSLDAILNKFGPLDETVVRTYTQQLLLALAYCHSKNITHRDLKAQNVLVDTKGTLKLADFGSAKQFAEAKAAPSLNYNYTPLWTAPEVLQGDYNSKIDVWSLGCVVIEMCTAKQPWDEKKFENPFRALYHIGNSKEIPQLPDNLSPEGTEFLLQCLERDPDKRWSAQELLSHPWLVDVETSAAAEEAAFEDTSNAPRRKNLAPLDVSGGFQPSNVPDSPDVVDDLAQATRQLQGDAALAGSKLIAPDSPPPPVPGGP